LGESLTERGTIDSLVLTTGHRAHGYAVPDAIKDLKQGTCVALYMAVGAAPQIVAQLNQTYPEIGLSVQVVAKAARQGQVVFDCPLEKLAQMLATHDIRGEAMLFVRWPHTNKRAASKPLAVA